ncbi:hypothetical protein THAOC_21271 [Thalassiosira oceanica]|uniref:Uncharacterized protein n=1 Tax=Thalassiosira oceanica TaxID=159749 RepID=K0RXR7_THAOC|nr:hypothetical protein THAOC_21271 [Thalassiosira oceanica]|eukprot:EJK58593.1 hypothetical protein THAOC_21271 [Thalassiosira oceanica]
MDGHGAEQAQVTIPCGWPVRRPKFKDFLAMSTFVSMFAPLCGLPTGLPTPVPSILCPIRRRWYSNNLLFGQEDAKGLGQAKAVRYERSGEPAARRMKQSFFEQPGGKGSDQGKRDTDDGQIRKVVTVTRCDKGAVLTLNGRSTTSEINNRVLAAISFATSKADNAPRRQAVGLGPRGGPQGSRKNLDQHNLQTLLVFQAGTQVTTHAGGRAGDEEPRRKMGDHGEGERNKTTPQVHQALQGGGKPHGDKGRGDHATLHEAMKHALGTNQDELKLRSGAQLGEEVRQRVEAAADAGVRVVIDRVEEAYMTSKLLSWDDPTNEEQTAGYSRITANQRTAMREQTQKQVEELIFTTSLAEYGTEGGFVDALNNKANLSGTDPFIGKTIVELTGCSAVTPAPSRDQKWPSSKARTAPVRRCSNKVCKDAKKDLGHGVKNCPNKENKEEDATTDGGLALATVSRSDQAIQRMLFGGAAAGGGTTTGFGLTTEARGNPSPASGFARDFWGGKAGVGPVSAMSANDVPSTGPQESVGVQSSQRSQTKGNDRIKSQRSHNLVKV